MLTKLQHSAHRLQTSKLMSHDMCFPNMNWTLRRYGHMFFIHSIFFSEYDIIL